MANLEKVSAPCQIWLRAGNLMTKGKGPRDKTGIWIQVQDCLGVVIVHPLVSPRSLCTLIREVMFLLMDDKVTQKLHPNVILKT